MAERLREQAMVAVLTLPSVFPNDYPLKMRAKSVAILAILLMLGIGIWKGSRTSIEVHVRQAAFWREWIAKPLAERVDAAPIEIVDFLRKQMGRPSIEQVKDVAFEGDLREALASLPKPFHQLLKDRCAGFLLVQNLGASAVTFAIRSEAGVETQAFVVLDRDWLNYPFQQWAELKESRFFNLKSDESLRLQSFDKKDDRVQTLLWLLLHEGGHVAQIGDVGIPSFDRRPDVKDFAQFEFTNLSWSMDGKGNFKSRFDDQQFIARREWPFRSNRPRLDANLLPQFFEQLQKTNFVSFEAAADPFEDFAESFAHYVYVEQMKRKWTLLFERAGKVVSSLPSCWHELRCAQKKSYLERRWAQMELELNRSQRP